MKIAFDDIVGADARTVGRGSLVGRSAWFARLGSPLDRRCERGARARTSLAGTADQADRAVASGRRRRYGGPDDRRTAGAAPRPADRHRQPSGRGRQHRHRFAAREKPDGYTLLMASLSPHSVNPHLYARLGFEPIRTSRRSLSCIRCRAFSWFRQRRRRTRRRNSSRSPRRARASSTSAPEDRDPRSTSSA